MKKYPFYIKSTVVLFGLILLSYALSNLKDILVPICFGLLLAILLNPVVTKLEKWKLPKVFAIAVTLVISIIVIVGVGYFLYIQISNFSSEVPAFQKKFAELFNNAQHEISHRFGLNFKKQNEYINQLEAGVKPLIGSTLGTVASSMGIIFLLPVYAFMFLFYKTLLLNFIYEVFLEENSKNVGTVLGETKKAVQHYMIGLLLEALIVASLNSMALLIIGVDYAILLGLLGAVLNILPFIGGILAVFLPLLIAFVTKDGFQSELWIIISYMVIQFTDNHFLVPYIVSSRVKINALISVIIVLLGGALWGIPGMFLSIPFIGTLKIIFDRIPELKPWGKLFGDEIPLKHRGQLLNSIAGKIGPRKKIKS